MKNVENKYKTADRKYAHIKGWGIDADADNDPTYPIKSRTNEEHKGYSWDRPKQQRITKKDKLHSIERPNVSAVFGTSVPRRGLSGLIRKLAFRYSESSYAHWLPLILADRVNVVEGLLVDLLRGRIPNYFKEKGFIALWKYNRKLFLKRVTPAAALASAGIIWLFRRNLILRKEPV